MVLLREQNERRLCSFSGLALCHLDMSSDSLLFPKREFRMTSKQILIFS